MHCPDANCRLGENAIHKYKGKVNQMWEHMNSIDLLRHGQRRVGGIGVETILVEVGKIHHCAIVKVGIEEEHWYLTILGKPSTK